MKLSQYRISRNNLVELLKQRDMFAADYYEKRMRMLARDVIGYLS